ncbi:hypothetical protein [Tenacibaculum amylolyticum]|uniref:hypothetical protein n=1 Tax=Tenacibaculum amylolyticum TaxID=104269 RepID=UPI003893AF6C
MQLNYEQISQIEHYLKKKGVYYEDIKIELLDHICIQIEALMSSGYDFNTSFEEIVEKWDPMLSYSSSFYLGYTYSKPKIIIDKMKLRVKGYVYKTWCIILLFLTFIYFTGHDIAVNNSQVINIFSLSFLYVSCIAIVAGYFFIRKTKQKTSYRFLYETQILPILTVPIILSNSILNKDGNLDLLKFMLLVFIVIAIPFGIELFKKHVEISKKYSDYETIE